MQVMNDLGQQIKGTRKRREKGFLGSPNSSSGMARGNLKAARVLGRGCWATGCYRKALGAGTRLPVLDRVVNSSLTVKFFLLQGDGQREAQRRSDIEAMSARQTQRLL